jgi:uncharacterized membrane protein
MLSTWTLALAAAWPLAVLAPELAYGSPSTARLGIALLLSAACFAILRSLVAQGRAAAVVAWVEARAGALALIVVALHTVVFGGSVVLRHVYFGAAHADDTAYYNQILWSTLQGEFFRGSVTQARYVAPPVSSEFALHNSPILLAVLPLYAVIPSFYTLLVLRTLALAAGAVALFSLAKEKIGGAAGLVIVVAYFASSNIFTQALSGFYPLHLIAFFLPWAFLYFYRERFWPFVLWLALALAVREEIALTGALFGIYALLLRRRPRWIVGPIALSAAWWFVSTELVMVRSRIAMEDLDAFYAMFGGGHNSALASVMRHPGAFLGLVLNADNVRYFYEVLKPTAMFALLSPSLLLALPTLAVNAVIGAFMITMRSVGYHYSLVAFICVFVAAIEGMARLSRSASRINVARSTFGAALALLLLPSAVLAFMDGIRYGGGQQTSVLAELRPKPYHATLERIVAMIPPGASVAAPNILMPQLSERRFLYSSDRLWRYPNQEAEYVVLDVRTDRSSFEDRNRAKYESTVATTRGDERYALVLAEAGFEVYHRILASPRPAVRGASS